MTPLTQQQQITMLTRVVELQGQRIAMLEARIQSVPGGTHVVFLAQLTEEVAAKYDVTIAEIMAQNPARIYSIPRQEIMGRASAHGVPNCVIGRFLGRDNSSVLHGIRAWTARHHG